MLSKYLCMIKHMKNKANANVHDITETRSLNKAEMSMKKFLAKVGAKQ